MAWAAIPSCHSAHSDPPSTVNILNTQTLCLLESGYILEPSPMPPSLWNTLLFPTEHPSMAGFCWLWRVTTCSSFWL